MTVSREAFVLIFFFFVFGLCVNVVLGGIREVQLVVDTNPVEDRDVCILGGGASGANLAYMLKDEGYDVLVIEKEGQLGGNCNTIRFTLDGNPVWHDPGVVIYPNTTFANEKGFGPWTIDMEKEISRFATIHPSPFGNTVPYSADFNTGVDMGLSAPTFDKLQMYQTYMRLQNQMNTTYRWLDSLLDVPDRIPPELLVSFDEWLTTNDYHILDYVFNSTIFGGGWGNFNTLTAWDALLQLSCTSTMFNLLPGSWFSIYNGCASLYEGIAKYLGDHHVMYNAYVTEATRLDDAKDSWPIHLKGLQDGKPFERRCKKLIVSYRQLPEHLAPLHLDPLESALFDTVETRSSMVGEVTVDGPITKTGTGWFLLNVNTSNPLGSYQPDTPTLQAIYNPHTSGSKAVLNAISSTYVSEEKFLEIIKEVGPKIPKTALEIKEYGKLWHHLLNPHWPRSVLAEPVNPYVRLDKLQGHRNTYWTGALRITETTGYIWNYNKVKIMPFFPSKVVGTRNPPIINNHRMKEDL